MLEKSLNSLVTNIYNQTMLKKLPENNTRNNYQKVKAMKENTFREKVAKYLAYAKILNDDKALRATVLAERDRMEAKIEKTMDYRNYWWK